MTDVPEAGEPYVAPPAPKFLHATGQHAWQKLCEELEIEGEDELALLAAYGAALDREAQSRRRIRDDGAWLTDRFDRLYSHPALAVERQSRAQAASILAQLQRAVLAFQKLDLAVERENRLRVHGGARAERTSRERRGRFAQ